MSGSTKSELLAAGNAFEIVLNVLLAEVPMVVIVPKQTTTIRASITVYSTAVGHLRKREGDGLAEEAYSWRPQLVRRNSMSK
jgi:hypothetical protein